MCQVRPCPSLSVSQRGSAHFLSPGKRRRLTLIECGSDLNTMLDVAKMADLILLVVDASFGFEMETFEFLNILQSHGFPKVMGVLTHLDVFHSAKTLRKTKKQLKQRFWTEIYQVLGEWCAECSHCAMICEFEDMYMPFAALVLS